MMRKKIPLDPRIVQNHSNCYVYKSLSIAAFHYLAVSIAADTNGLFIFTSRRQFCALLPEGMPWRTANVIFSPRGDLLAINSRKYMVRHVGGEWKQAKMPKVDIACFA